MKKLFKLVCAMFTILILISCDNVSLRETKAANIKKSVNFKYVYTGFVIEKSNNKLPVGTIVLDTKKKWKEYKNKYFYNCEDMDYSFYFNTINFKKQELIYNSQFSAKQDVMASAYLISKVYKSKNKVSVNICDLPENLKITTANIIDASHRYVILLLIDK